MYNDSIETLLLRHYGSAAPLPAGLEQQVVASVRHEAAQLRAQERLATRIRERRISRRRVIRLVAIGSAGLGLLSVGVESLQTLLGQDTRPAYS